MSSVDQTQMPLQLQESREGLDEAEGVESNCTPTNG